MAEHYRRVLGQRIRERRIGRNPRLTQHELAEQVDLTDETISRLERGVVDPSVPALIRIADALQVDVDYLLGRKGKPTTRRIAVPAQTQRLVSLIERLPSAAVQTLTRTAELLAERGTSTAQGPSSRKKRG